MSGFTTKFSQENDFLERHFSGWIVWIVNSKDTSDFGHSYFIPVYHR